MPRLPICFLQQLNGLPKTGQKLIKPVCLLLTLFQPPPQLAASGLFNFLLGAICAHWPPIAERCHDGRPSRSSTASASSFLSTLLLVALQTSGGRQCQAFQLFKQVSDWSQVLRRGALPLLCPILLVCANCDDSIVSAEQGAGIKGTHYE